jgi:hypothetical protein
MLLIGNKDILDIHKELFPDKNIIKEEDHKDVIVTSKSDLYKKWKGQKVFSTTMLGIPNKSFEIALCDRIIFNNNYQLLKLGNIVNTAIITKDFSKNYNITNFYDLVDKISIQLKRIEEIKEKNIALKENYKLQNAKIRKQNKKLKEDYKVLVSLFKEGKLDNKPTKPVLKEKLKEPDYIVVPSSLSIHKERLDQTSPWKLLRRFSLKSIKDTNLKILIKRETELSFTEKNVLSLLEEKMTISIEEVLELLKKKDSPLKEQYNITQNINSLIVGEKVISVVANNEKGFNDMLFSEGDMEDLYLAPLAPIKPVLAASMLAGGLDGFYKEVELNNEKIAMKGAIVKEFNERTVVTPDYTTKEIIETNEQKIGLYYLDSYEFKILG